MNVLCISFCLKRIRTVYYCFLNTFNIYHIYVSNAYACTNNNRRCSVQNKVVHFLQPDKSKLLVIWYTGMLCYCHCNGYNVMIMNILNKLTNVNRYSYIFFLFFTVFKNTKPLLFSGFSNRKNCLYNTKSYTV